MTPTNPHAEASETLRKKIIELKGKVNPKTKRLFTYEEVGKKLGMSGQGAHHYIRTIKGICPSCCRPIEGAGK